MEKVLPTSPNLNLKDSFNRLGKSARKLSCFSWKGSSSLMVLISNHDLLHAQFFLNMSVSNSNNKRYRPS